MTEEAREPTKERRNRLLKIGKALRDPHIAKFIGLHASGKLSWEDTMEQLVTEQAAYAGRLRDLAHNWSAAYGSVVRRITDAR